MFLKYQAIKLCKDYANNIIHLIHIISENGQPLPFPTHPALTAALQCGPDGKLEGDTSLGTRALESCAYLAQSMLAHNFRDGPPISSHEMEMFQVLDFLQF